MICPHPESHPFGSLLPHVLAYHRPIWPLCSSLPGADCHFILKCLDHWWKHHAFIYTTSIVQTASDWGCCFSSCLLCKLIWPQTFALLGAKRDVMLADTSWRLPSPPLPLADSRRSGESLVLYLTARSYPNITSPLPDRGKNSTRRGNTENTIVCRPRAERAPPLQC